MLTQSGEIITHCSRPGIIALTFDDGPGAYTSDLLNLLDRHSVRATFFITGNNMAPNIDVPSTGWPALLRRMYDTGHQLGSHTWTHLDLSSADEGVRDGQMLSNEEAFLNIFGFYPTYMRPPYGSCERGCLDRMAGLGYHVINWNVDTQDWAHQDNIGESMANFDQAVEGDPGANSYIVLAHDIHGQTVYALANYMIETALARGYQLVTVGECLGDPRRNWYSRRLRS